MTHIPTWFEFIQPLLAESVPMHRATVKYFQTYHADIYEDAKLIATEAATRAERLHIPETAAFPDDISGGVQLVMAILEEIVLKE